MAAVQGAEHERPPYAATKMVIPARAMSRVLKAPHDRTVGKECSTKSHHIRQDIKGMSNAKQDIWTNVACA